jgi:hypothetical protein
MGWMVYDTTVRQGKQLETAQKCMPFLINVILIF